MYEELFLYTEEMQLLTPKFIHLSLSSLGLFHWFLVYMCGISENFKNLTNHISPSNNTPLCTCTKPYNSILWLPLMAFVLLPYKFYHFINCQIHCYYFSFRQ